MPGAVVPVSKEALLSGTRGSLGTGGLIYQAEAPALGWRLGTASLCPAHTALCSLPPPQAAPGYAPSPLGPCTHGDSCLLYPALPLYLLTLLILGGSNLVPLWRAMVQPHLFPHGEPGS